LFLLDSFILLYIDIMRNVKNFKKSSKSQKALVTQLERDEERQLVRLQPLQWEPCAVIGGEARYNATSALTLTTLTIKDLISVPGVFATTTVLAYAMAVAVRIRKIRIWGFVATAGTAVNVRVQKAGIDSTSNDYNDSFKQVQDTSNSFDRPAYVEIKFDRYTPSGAFHTSANISGNLVNITCPAGSVVDIFYSYVPGWATPASGTTWVVGSTAGTTGRMTICSNNLNPVGVNVLG
jgi:hypothetical protein